MRPLKKGRDTLPSADAARLRAFKPRASSQSLSRGIQNTGTPDWRRKCTPAGLFAAADLVRACNERVGKERVTLVWASTGGKIAHAQGGPSVTTRVTPADDPCDAWLVPGLWMRSPEELPAICARQAPLIA